MTIVEPTAETQAVFSWLMNESLVGQRIDAEGWKRLGRMVGSAAVAMPGVDSKTQCEFSQSLVWNDTVEVDLPMRIDMSLKKGKAVLVVSGAEAVVWKRSVMTSESLEVACCFAYEPLSDRLFYNIFTTEHDEYSLDDKSPNP